MLLNVVILERYQWQSEDSVPRKYQIRKSTSGVIRWCKSHEKMHGRVANFLPDNDTCDLCTDGLHRIVVETVRECFPTTDNFISDVKKKYL